MKVRSLRRVSAVAVLSGALLAGLVSPAEAASSTPTYSQWISDVTAVATPAQAYIASRIASASSTSSLAIVLDIDNTALANYYFPTTVPTPADPPVLQIAQYAAAHGVKVFFVTARPDLIDLITEYNLKAVGYTVDGLYSRNVLQLFESVQTFKTAERKMLEDEGFDIIANIGNNWVDLNGGYADTTWKLPDYNGLLD
jgi:predicted secreted acid phosphatase